MRFQAKLVYIMGRGHSGSTVLDVMLGNATDGESVGELISGITRPAEICSCGANVADCPFWQKVQAVFVSKSDLDGRETVEQLVDQGHVRHFVSTLLTPKDTSQVRELSKANSDIVEAILTVSDKQFVVDSSKEPTRGLFLARFLPHARIIHLLRNPERIQASNLARISSGSGFKFLRKTFRNKHLSAVFIALSSLSWVAGNLLAELIRLVFPSRVIRVRYEDLCAHPEPELTRIACFIGHDLDNLIGVVKARKPMTVGHNIGGNRVRMKRELVFDPQAGNKRRSLPWYYRAMVRMLTFPSMIFYGYSPFTN